MPGQKKKLTQPPRTGKLQYITFLFWALDAAAMVSTSFVIGNSNSPQFPKWCSLVKS